MTFYSRPGRGSVVEPSIAGGALVPHRSESMLLVRIAAPPAFQQVIEGRIQHGVHAPDMDSHEPYCARGEPRFPKIVVRGPQKVFGRYLHTIKINDMAPRRAHT